MNIHRKEQCCSRKMEFRICHTMKMHATSNLNLRELSYSLTTTYHLLHVSPTGFMPLSTHQPTQPMLARVSRHCNPSEGQFNELLGRVRPKPDPHYPLSHPVSLLSISLSFPLPTLSRTQARQRAHSALVSPSLWMGSPIVHTEPDPTHHLPHPFSLFPFTHLLGFVT